MPQSFANLKDIRVTITLGTGTFDGSNNVITIQGLRTIVDIDRGGGQTLAQLNCNIYGVSASDMNAITTLQLQALQGIGINTISVMALDGAQETLVYQGDIVQAFGNYESQPEVFLNIQARAACINSLAPIGPSSYQGAADVATIMGNIIATMNANTGSTYTLENNGVQVQISNPYLPGTGMQQVQELADAAGIWWYLDNDTLVITPKGTPRSTTLIPEISTATGLIGYPTPDGINGVTFTTIFNPNIRFMAPVQLDTSIPKAQGQWNIIGIRHHLESNKPAGAWFSYCTGIRMGLVV